MSLNAKQQRFVEEYLVDLNATQAAVRAGYSAKTATVQGSRLLTNAKVAAAVADAKQNRSERVGATTEWILAKLVENVERSMQATPVLDSEGDETGEYVYQGNVANKALELLGKYAGMWVERTQNYDFNPDDFSVEGLRRIEKGEDPVQVLVSGGRRADSNA